MARYDCERCGETCFTTNPEHLCKDLRKRLERQIKQVGVVYDILLDAAIDPIPSRLELAEQIVKALTHLGINQQE